MKEEEENQNSCCRLCLKSGNNMENLFADDSKYIFLIEDFTGLKLEYVTGLPSVICETCLEKINILIDFQETCRKSQEIFEIQRNNIKIEKISSNVNETNNDLVFNLDLIKTENESTYEERIFNCTIDKDDQEKKINISDKSHGSLSNNNHKKLKKLSQTTINYKDDVIIGDHNEKLNLSKTDEKFELSESYSDNTSQIEYNKNLSKSKQIGKNVQSEHNEKNSRELKSKGNRSEDFQEKNHSSKLAPCYICGKIINKFRMELHLNIHFDRRPYKCGIESCNKAFASPRQLRQHNSNAHSTEKPFECEICGRCYKSNSSLKLHKTYHFDPQIPCSVCGKLLRNHKSIRQHMLSHSGERRHECDFCSKSYRDSWTLKVHLRKIHKKEKPIICSICEKSFGHNYGLKRHMEKIHPENEIDSDIQTITKHQQKKQNSKID